MTTIIASGRLDTAKYCDNYLIYDLSVFSEYALNYANKHECVYFYNRDFQETFVNYLSTCKNTHVTFWVNTNNTPNEIKLSDAIKSVTMVGVDCCMPLVIGKNLKKIYLSGDQSCGFKQFDMLPKNIKELGLIDACYATLNIDILPENIKTIVVIDQRLNVKKVPATVNKIVYMPIIVCKNDDNPTNIHHIEIASNLIDKFEVANPENLQMTIKIEPKTNKYLCRLDLRNGDSVVVRFPDAETADKYLYFGDDGYKFANILLAIGTGEKTLNYIALGEITDNDTILDWRHIKK